jgi:UDP-glucose 4-epimerase
LVAANFPLLPESCWLNLSILCPQLSASASYRLTIFSGERSIIFGREIQAVPGISLASGELSMEKVFIAGGAGFIGSHFARRLLASDAIKQVTAYDNFSSGKAKMLEHLSGDKRLALVQGEIHDNAALQSAMRGHDTVIHLASNPDIAKAATEPSVDFHQGTVLTHQIVEAMRIEKVGRILYASGSGVYGELGEYELAEDFGPLKPISTYGASKLAGETLICSYAHMFDLRGVAFRFGNVVGPNQTHGVAYDFLKKLKANPARLDIFGDGSQSKSYVYVDDVIDAVLLAEQKVDDRYDVFNVATGDYITVKEIAEIVIKEAIGSMDKTEIVYSGGDRGWKGDIPIVRLSKKKIEGLGWRCKRTSKQAIIDSTKSMHDAYQKLSQAVS